MCAIRLICGLGNPPDQYRGTRHNLGFAWLDLLATHYRCSQWRKRQKHGLYTTWTHLDQTIYLFKPTTYMNVCGPAIRGFCQYQRIHASDALIVYDDLDTTCGQIRWKAKGSHGGHNGVRDTIEHLGTDTFPRLRLGIDRPPQGHDISAYVLCRPSPEEKKRQDTAMQFSIQKAHLLLENPILYQQKLREWNQQQEPFNGI